ncbi:hypothetical protein Micbo1qcDRAFT_140322 [Microdochium bolleyi]|uniref:Tat pathway signal sequence n=1 Tax=Microdochium bolleyi TaxID=196109 RepID=A0A136IN99_9PEZI|nr:hypothetical protein Micbo1qcDRAFT_140322 [Microdochium bolleyi]
MSRLGFFQSGYHTDFVTSRNRIQASRHRFYGSPAFHADGGIYLPNPDPVRYVGDPTIYPEIDRNWDNLTWGRYVLITEEEAKSTWGDNIADYFDHQRGGYVAGFDVFHTLHCLNNIRKALDPLHYPAGHAHNHSAAARGNPANDALHQDHCLEQLRQYIMCSGDMTPLPTKFYPGLGRNYVDSDVEHTCRDFNALHDWVMNRYEGPGAVQPVP